MRMFGYGVSNGMCLRLFVCLFISMFRLSTGEGWSDLVEILQKEKSLGHQCIENPTYSDFVEAGMKPIGCGNLLLI